MFATIIQPRSLALAAALFLGTAAANAHPGRPVVRGRPEPARVVVHERFVPTAHFHYARDYHGWKGYCYFPGYRCYGYYDPSYTQWFYWYQPGDCYLPISEMSAYPPVDTGFAPVQQTTGSPIPLPPGATLAPGQ